MPGLCWSQWGRDRMTCFGRDRDAPNEVEMAQMGRFTCPSSMTLNNIQDRVTNYPQPDVQGREVMKESASATRRRGHRTVPFLYIHLQRRLTVSDTEHSMSTRDNSGTMTSTRQRSNQASPKRTKLRTVSWEFPGTEHFKYTEETMVPAGLQ